MSSTAFLLLATVCALHVCIGLFVFLKNTRDETNRLFFGFVLSLVAWLLSNYFSNDMDVSKSTALIINKLVFIFPVLILYFLLRFALKFTRIYLHPQTYNLIKGLTIILLVVCGSPLLVSDIAATNGVYQINFGPLGVAFFAYVAAYFFFAIATFIIGIRQQHSSDRMRTEIVLWSLFLGLVISIFTNAIMPALLNSYDYSALGPISTVIISIGFAYAIIRHRLFDIRLVVARSVAYSLLLATLAASYATIMFSISTFFFPNGMLTSAQSAVYIALAILLAFTFQPLKTFFQRSTDRFFFRDNYDPQEVLNAVGQILLAEFILKPLLEKTLARICQDLRIGSGHFYVFDRDKIYMTQHYGVGIQDELSAQELSHLRHRVIIADELEGGSEKRLMAEEGIRVAIRLRTREEFVGYLLLGDKLSGDIYSRQDINVLEILGQEMAVAISNAKAYAEIDRFNVTLRGKVDDATKRLRHANSNLKQLDEAKDEFISIASHQLRTPLTSIKGYVSMLLEGDGGKLTDTQRQFLETTYNSSQQMVSLITDMLNVSRMSAGKFMIEASSVDLTRVTVEEIQQLKQHADDKGIKLIFASPKHIVPFVTVDEGKTRQVIMNFVDNAIYYTKEGSVTVMLEYINGSIEFRVQDTGIGVPDEAKSKLFSKFYRADNAQTVRPDGTGLGLFLAKRIIEEQGGKILFASQEGKGSTFGFSLPVKTAPCASAAHQG